MGNIEENSPPLREAREQVAPTSRRRISSGFHVPRLIKSLKNRWVTARVRAKGAAYGWGSKRFAGQGAYRAQMYLKYGIIDPRGVLDC